MRKLAEFRPQIHDAENSLIFQLGRQLSTQGLSTIRQPYYKLSSNEYKAEFENE
jgi:hypothetical protein